MTKRFKAPLTPVAIVQKLLIAKTKKLQEKILCDAWEFNCDDFFLGLQMAVDPDIKFNLISAPEIQDVDTGDPGTFTFVDFRKLAKNLVDKDIVGDVAKRAIVDAALKANITEWNLWYRRILLKTLPNVLPMDVVISTLSRLTTT
jgi:hypothetical protein